MNWYKSSKIKNKSNNVALMYEKLHTQIKKHGLKSFILGKVQDYPIYLVTSPDFNSFKKNILICGGFHGEEPSGSWGVISFLEQKYDRYKDAFNISFLPIVNPTGLRHNRREDYNGDTPNRGYIHNDKMKEKSSEEDKILQKHMSIISRLASGGCLSLHEDRDKESFYMYSYEKSDKPTDKTYKILQIGESLFGKTQKQHVPSTPLGTNLKHEKKEDGLCFNDCDGTFEDLIFHRGSDFCVVTETPVQMPLESRNKANVKIICQFLAVV